MAPRPEPFPLHPPRVQTGRERERPEDRTPTAVQPKPGPPVAHAPGSPIQPAAHAQPSQPLPPPPAKELPKPADAAPPPPSPAPPPVAGTPASVGGPLPLDEVLAAVEQHYPLLRAVEQERAVAGGRLLTSLGVFDLNATAGVDGQGTTYDNVRSGVGLNQGLPVGGVGYFLRYRNGVGDFPTYNLGQKTADGGELQAGISLPLLRDRDIDRPRATVQQARIDIALAEPTIDRQRLDFQRAAARTYWNWVGSGHRLRVADELLRLAVVRDEQIAGRIVVRLMAPIDRVDNQQNIALRNGLLVQAQRGFQQAAIELSLFLRDAAGTPTLAGTDRLPAFPAPEPLDPAGFDSALRTAFDLRPEPRRFRLLKDRTAVELRLAENQTQPALNAVAAVAQDVGPGKSSLSGPNGLERTTVTGGLAFALPVQRRDARGRMLTAQAQLAQLSEQLRQAEDVVRAEVQDGYSAVERAYEFYKQAKARVVLAREMAEAERERLRLNQSDVLRVTLREQVAFDAEVFEIGAQQDYFRALADLRAALGQGP